MCIWCGELGWGPAPSFRHSSRYSPGDCDNWDSHVGQFTSVLETAPVYLTQLSVLQDPSASVLNSTWTFNMNRAINSGSLISMRYDDSINFLMRALKSFWGSPCGNRLLCTLCLSAHDSLLFCMCWHHLCSCWEKQEGSWNAKWISKSLSSCGRGTAVTWNVRNWQDRILWLGPSEIPSKQQADGYWGEGKVSCLLSSGIQAPRIPMAAADALKNLFCIVCVEVCYSFCSFCVCVAGWF